MTEPIPILEAGARTGHSTTDPRAGIGVGRAGDPMFTLQSGKQHAVTFAQNTRTATDPNQNIVAFQPGNLTRRAGSNPSEEVFPTLGAATLGDQAPCVTFQYGVRRLTPVECERLQGFEDGFTAGQSDSARYKQLGNAVTVNVSRWLAQRIKLHLAI